MIKSKRCSKCRVLKIVDSSNFNKNKAQRDGFANVCKDCRTEERTSNYGKAYISDYVKDKRKVK